MPDISKCKMFVILAVFDRDEGQTRAGTLGGAIALNKRMVEASFKARILPTIKSKPLNYRIVEIGRGTRTKVQDWMKSVDLAVGDADVEAMLSMIVEVCRELADGLRNHGVPAKDFEALMERSFGPEALISVRKMREKIRSLMAAAVQGLVEIIEVVEERPVDLEIQIEGEEKKQRKEKGLREGFMDRYANN
jgi:hypothetical protein